MGNGAEVSDKAIWILALFLSGLLFTAVTPPLLCRALVPPRPTEAGKEARRKCIIGAVVLLWTVLAVPAVAATPGSHAG